NQTIEPRAETMIRSPSYTGCGYAIRLAAYRGIRGSLPRHVPYGMEETDVSLQLFAAGWGIYEAGTLRGFHDTELAHHATPEIVSGTVSNVALCDFLNYPVRGWGWGLLQLANIVAYSIRMGRVHGLLRGILSIPGACWHNRYYRNPIAWSTV